jgi:hypothetical protein
MSGIFPEGFTSVERGVEDVKVDLIQDDPSGPVWRVTVRPLSIKEYRKIFSKGQRTDGGGGFRQQSAQQDRVDKEYLGKVVIDWEGCTCANWNALLKDGKKLVPPAGKENAEIAFTDDLMFYVYRNTWPADVADPIFNAVKNGVEEQEAEEERTKNS